MQKHLGGWPEYLQRDEKKPITYTLGFVATKSFTATGPGATAQTITVTATVGGGTQTSLTVTVRVTGDAHSSWTSIGDGTLNGWVRSSGWTSSGTSLEIKTATYTKTSVGVGTDAFTIIADSSSDGLAAHAVTVFSGASTQVGSASPQTGVNYNVYFWQFDATSFKHVPHSSTDWTNFRAYQGEFGNLTAYANPDTIWRFQETSGNVSDFGTGSRTATAAGSPSYNQAVSGWTRKSINLAAAGSAYFTATIPAGNTTSFLMVAYVALTSTPSTVQAVFEHVDLVTGVTTTPTYRASGGSIVNGASNCGTTVHPVVVRVDLSTSTTKVYTDQEIIACTFFSTAGTTFTFGDASAQGAPMALLWAAVWTGTNGERTEAQIRTLLQCLNWTIPW